MESEGMFQRVRKTGDFLYKKAFIYSFKKH